MICAKQNETIQLIQLMLMQTYYTGTVCSFLQHYPTKLPIQTALDCDRMTVFQV